MKASPVGVGIAAESAQTNALRVSIHVSLVPGRGIGGMETTLAGLIHALGKLEGPEEYFLIGNRLNAEWLRSLAGPNQRIIISPNPRLYGRLSSRNGSHVIHLPTPPRQYSPLGKPTVYTVHDLLHLQYPEFFSPGGVAAREEAFRSDCRQACLIVAISEWVKHDVVRRYGIDSEKIRVIPWGPPTLIYSKPSKESISAIRETYHLQKPFALYPAMIHPHKNHVRLLEAVAFLRDREGLEVRLVCTGALHPYWQRIKERLTTLSLENQVRFLGLVPGQDLRAIYGMAEFVVFPSLSEGSGVPVLEAWQEGLPVACSAVTGLAENAQDAAVTFDPVSVESIASAIRDLWKSDELRDEYRSRGKVRLQSFSWQQASIAYRRVYREVAGVAL